MRRADFAYDLPEDLIAQRPPIERSGSRLLHLERATTRLHDLRFTDLPSLLRAGDLLVFNDTPGDPGAARSAASRQAGEWKSCSSACSKGVASSRMRMRASRSKRYASWHCRAACRLTASDVATICTSFDVAPDPLAYLEQHGRMPLPPYIQRAAGRRRRERYQTVFAREPGAVAAPTAGLHFDEALLDALSRAGVEFGARHAARRRRHVPAGARRRSRPSTACTASALNVGADAVRGDRRAHARRGGRVIAVGTTVVRALEAAAQRRATLAPFAGETRLFITPGLSHSRRRCAGHQLPSAREHVADAGLRVRGPRRSHASAYRARGRSERYRFFSYGDAMLLLPDGARHEPHAFELLEHRRRARAAAA